MSAPATKERPAPGDDGHQNILTLLYLVQDGVQIPKYLLIQRIEGIGPVHGDDAHGALLLKGDKRHSLVSSLFLFRVKDHFACFLVL